MAVIAFAWLNHINPEFVLTDDGVRDQLGDESVELVILRDVEKIRDPALHEGSRRPVRRTIRA
jgi:hypothetical protein